MSHIQVELPTPANPNTSWSRDAVHTFDQLARPLFIPNGYVPTSSWNSGHLVSLTRSIPNGRSTDNEVLLSQKLLGSRARVNCIQRSGPSIDLNDSDLDADADTDTDDERPHSTLNSLTDLSENEQMSHFTDAGEDDCVIPTITEPDGYSVPPSLTRSTRIRFRSRVRITSGINRHRHSESTKGAGANNSMRSTAGESSYYFLSPESSLSASPSSSISVPLRSRTDDEADRPGWGPLGQRVSMFAKQKNKTRNQGCHGQVCRKCTRAKGPSDAPLNETSPLLMPPAGRKQGNRQHIQAQRRRSICYCPDSGSPYRRLSPEEVDDTFGKWPNRVLNYQWWWWQAETIICCRCLDESDDEHF